MVLTPEQLEEKLLDSKRTPKERYEKMIDDAIECEDEEIKEDLKEFLLEYALENDGIDFEKEDEKREDLDEKFDMELTILEATDIEEALKNGEDWINLPVPDFNYNDYKLIMELSKKSHIDENPEMDIDINEDIIKTKAFSGYLRRKGFNSYLQLDNLPYTYILEFKK